MISISFKIQSVTSHVTAEGTTDTVNLQQGTNSPMNAMHHMMGMSLSLDITGKKAELAFFESNVGSFIELPIDVSKLTAVKPVTAP